MRKLLFTIITLCLVAVAYAGDTIRVLCIGNSFSMDAVEQNLYEMAKAEGIEMIIGDVYYGGCSLEQHVKFLTKGESPYTYNKIVDGKMTSQKDMPLMPLLLDEKWDYVSLQQASHYSGKPDSYEPWLTQLYDTVRRYCPEAKMVWHMTWAYAQDTPHNKFYWYNNLQTTMYKAILDCVNDVVRFHPFSVIVPAGMAIQNGRESKLGDTFCRDGYHLERTYGRYTAACAWYEALTGLNPIENTYKPENVTYEQMHICQRAAHKAYLKLH